LVLAEIQGTAGSQNVPDRQFIWCLAALRRWLKERNGQATDTVFPNARGQSLSRDRLEHTLSQYLNTAKARCPSLKNKRVAARMLCMITMAAAAAISAPRNTSLGWTRAGLTLSTFYVHFQRSA